MRDRRFYPSRRALVRQVLDEVFSQRIFTLRAVDCARLFGVPTAACERIFSELEEAGIVQQAGPGLWLRRAHAPR